MVTAIASHRAQSSAQPTNTAPSPPCWYSQPPKMPPSAAPRNWLVAYTPIAVPLPPAGATLLTSDGREASSRLKAVKNATAPTTSATRPPPSSQKYSSQNSRTATAAQNTRFIRRFFSA